jgi:hypothetical protein
VVRTPDAAHSVSANRLPDAATTVPILEADAGAAQPSGPLVLIVPEEEFGFELRWKDLPAVSRNGKTLVVPSHEPDTDVGRPNLDLQTLSMADEKLLDSQVIVSITEVPKIQISTVRDRVATANKRLQSEDLVPLAELPVTDLVPRQKAQVTFGKTVVTYEEPNLDVAEPGSPPHRATESTWLVRGHQNCPSCPPCDQPGYLYDAWASGTDLIVQISYRGSHACEEVAPTFHVVHLGSR